MSDFFAKKAFQAGLCTIMYAFFAAGAFMTMIFFGVFTKSVCSQFSFSSCLEQLEELDITSIVKFCQELISKIALSDALEALIEDTGLFAEVFSAFLNPNGEKAQILFDGNILIYITEITVANLLLFVFFRINVPLISIFGKGPCVKIGQALASIMITLSSFAIASDLVDLISFFCKASFIPVCLSVAVFCFFLHTKWLSGSEISKNAVIKYLALNLIFGIINSFIATLICICCLHLFAFLDSLPFVIAFTLCSLFLMIEDEIRLRI